MSINMIPGLAMVLLKYFLNIDTYFKSKFAIRCKPCYRFPFRRQEESPDSTEQCTGEQPGISTNAEKYVGVTESATENNYSASGREKMKMWGKSPQLLMVTSFAGKPCMLKCHVKYR